MTTTPTFLPPDTAEPVRRRRQARTQKPNDRLTEELTEVLVDVINDGFNHELTHTPVSEFAALIAERDADIAQAKQEARRLVEELTPAEIRARIKLLGGKRRCSVDGCESKHRARGFCFGHYKRFRRYGDPLGTRPCRLCAIDGCDQEHYARSYCYKHYKKARRSGDLVAGRVSQGGAE